ncbi:MAG: hypothetical protein WCA20_33255, partial [Candidatus Sulfotelmatobacter sp.]
LLRGIACVLEPTLQKTKGGPPSRLSSGTKVEYPAENKQVPFGCSLGFARGYGKTAELSQTY